jgi:acetyl-CoA C-acetyltransferase
MTVNKVCGSGLKSVMLATDSIRLGESSVAIAGGMENMSLAPYLSPSARFGQRMGHGELRDMLLHDGLLDPYSGQHMGEITEQWVVDKEISRAEQDEYAARSYRLSQAAVQNGTFADELVPVVKKTRKGEVVVAEDEEPSRGKIEKLSELRAAFAKDGRITAGNASTINDGAALLLLTDVETVNRYDLKPMARVVASATNSIAPELFAEAPVDAIRKCVAKAGLEIADVDLFEINEAFAAVPLLAMRELAIPLDKVNVNGGAVALGHPIGASGARLATTLIREMRHRQVRYGVASLCIGGGEAVATLFERV